MLLKQFKSTQVDRKFWVKVPSEIHAPPAVLSVFLSR